jgi:hypothetical protein
MDTSTLNDSREQEDRQRGRDIAKETGDCKKRNAGEEKFFLPITLDAYASAGKTMALETR